MHRFRLTDLSLMKRDKRRSAADYIEVDFEAKNHFLASIIVNVIFHLWKCRTICKILALHFDDVRAEVENLSSRSSLIHVYLLLKWEQHVIEQIRLDRDFLIVIYIMSRKERQNAGANLRKGLKTNRLANQVVPLSACLSRRSKCQLDGRRLLYYPVNDPWGRSDVEVYWIWHRAEVIRVFQSQVLSLREQSKKTGMN